MTDSLQGNAYVNSPIFRLFCRIENDFFAYKYHIGSNFSLVKIKNVLAMQVTILKTNNTNLYPVSHTKENEDT